MRKHGLDNLRWGTVILVVVYHVFFIYSGTIPGAGLPFGEIQYQDALLYLLYPWMMVLLFCIAGISARHALAHHTPKAYFRSRTRKLLVPGTLGLLVLGWLQGLVNMEIAGAFSQMPAGIPLPVYYVIATLSGVGVLWFIQMLWLYTLLLLLLRHWETGRLFAKTGRLGVIAALLLGVLVWLSGLVLNVPVVTVYRFGIYGVAFFLGYFVFAHDAVIQRIARWRFVLIPSALVLGGVYVWLHFGDNYAVMPTVNAISAVAFGWVTLLALFAAAHTWWNRETAVTRWLRGHSWGLYLFHYLPLSWSAYLMQTYTQLPPWLCYLCSGVAAFVGGWGLACLVPHIPGVRWLLMGIRKEKEPMFSANLLQLRKLHGLTQEAVAEAVQVSRQAVAKWESGETVPDLDRCRALAELFDVSLDDLANHTPEQHLGLGVPPKGKHLFGVVTVGEKGQIVIPAKARSTFSIAPGDKLVVLGDESQGLALLQADRFLAMADQIQRSCDPNP